MSDEMINRINRQALFADETFDYRRPEEPEAGQRVSLRFRTAKGNADHVYFLESGRKKTEMKKVSSDTLFDYYEHQIRAGKKTRRYCFKIESGTDVCYYNRLGPVPYSRIAHAFCITPGFHTPEWAKGAVMYQIFVDRFCNGDPTNDVLDDEYIYIGQPVRQVKDWSSYPESLDVRRFYGGDLQGVWDKLDYLQDLGVEVIYFNPLFVSASNHKYDTQDYDYIDPHFGVIVEDEGELAPPGAMNNAKATRYQKRSAGKKNLEASNEFFARLVAEIHRRGMKVIIDGVFNHCGSFNKWLDREGVYAGEGGYAPGAYAAKNSPYHTFFEFRDPNGWPDNASYDSWWGNDTLPKLNYEDSPKLYEYMMRIARKWVSEPYCVDGWRLDVAADLGHSSAFNHKFWQDFRKNVKAANPNAIILAEHYGDAGSWLQGDQWDSVMNYDAFMEPLGWFLTGMEKHSDSFQETLYGDGEQFFRTMSYNMCKMQGQSVMVAMNQLSNHDHSRFLTRTNQMVGRLAGKGAKAAEEGVNYGIFSAAIMVQMTWPGAPTVYYGDEAGVCGWTDPDNRRTYPWGNENKKLIAFHRAMIALHKKLPALRRGSLKPLLADRQLIAYGRMRGANRCMVAVNNSMEARHLTVPVWQLGIVDGEYMSRVMLTDLSGYHPEEMVHQVEDGALTLDMPPYSSVLFSCGEIL
ncbi:MAG: glycoside hydrolase family 13 protein [Brotaphodocola sp.]